MADSNGGGNSSKVFMLAAIVLGVLAMVMAFAFIQNASSVDNQQKMDVVMAQHDINPGASLNPDSDFKIVKWTVPVNPADAAKMKSRMLDAAAWGQYKGERVNRFIPADTPLFLADVGGQLGTLDLADPWMAMSISVKGPNALGGMLQAGNYVRLLVTRPNVGAPTDATVANSKWETLEILPSDPPLKVLAVNNRLSGGLAPLMVGGAVGGGGSVDAQQTIMLRVTLSQSKTIQALSGNSQLPITLLLASRPPDEAAPSTPATPPVPAGRGR